MAKGTGIKANKGGGGASTSGGASMAPAPAFPSTDEGLLASLKRFDSEHSGTLMHPMAEAREASPLKGDAFDKAMMRLSFADKIVLHNHDYADNVPAAQRASFIKHYDNYYHVWSTRTHT